VDAATVPVDASCTSVVNDGTVALLNDTITYSEAVESPPTQSDAISVAVSARTSATAMCTASAGEHAGCGKLAATVIAAVADFVSLVATIVAVPGEMA